MKPHIHPALLAAVMACMIAPAQALNQTLADGFESSITLTAGANTITVNGTDSADITLLITVGALTPADFTKEGTGTLTIGGVSLNALTTKPLYTINGGRLILDLTTINILAMSPNYAINTGAVLQMNAGGTFASALGISGAGTLQFSSGATTLTLKERTGAATLTNNLIFSTGANNLTLDSSLTAMQGSINSGGNLTLTTNNVTTFGNAVTATGTLLLNRGADAAHAVRTFNGTVSAGALSLQAGTSTVHSGITLNQGGTVTGALTAQGYADIAIAANKTLTAGSYVSTGGNNTVSGTLSLSGNATISGLNDIWTGTVSSANLGINTGASLSMNSASYTLGAGGQIAIGNTGTSGTGTLNITGTSTVNGSTGTIAIGTAAGTTGALNIQNTSVVNTGGITINKGTATLSNTATLNIGASGIAGTGTVNFNGGTTIGSLADWSSASGISYAINGATDSVINTNGHNVTINGGITGTGSLNKTGLGTLTISGSDKAFTGTAISVSAGTLALNVSAANILAMAPYYSIANGATLQLNSGTYASPLKITGTGSLAFGNGATTVTLKENAGATALGNNITFGNVASTLTLDPTLTTLQGTLTAGSDLALNGSQFTTANGAVNVAGKLTLGLAGDAAHATRTFNSLVTAGSLTLQAGTSAIASAASFAQGATITGALTTQGYANIGAVAGQQISAGSYVSTGGNNTVSGTLNVSGNAIISGLNDIWTGTVNSANLSINTGASLSMNSASYTLGAGGQIAIGNTGTSGTGTLNITGTSTVNGSTGTIAIGNTNGTSGALNIQNTSVVNTGGITINNGTATLSNTATLNIGSSGISGTGTVNFNGGTTIGANTDWTSAAGVTYAINGSTNSTVNTNGHNVAINGNISGSGQLSKTGQGTLTISGGDKTFTGTTTAAQGTVQIDANMYGSGNTYVAAGGTLSVSNTGNIGSGGATQATSTVQVTAKAAGTNATLNNARVTATGIVSVDGTGAVKAAVNDAKVTINRTGAAIEHSVLTNTAVSLAQNASVTLNDVVIGAGTQIAAAAGVVATTNLQNTTLRITNAQLSGTLTSKVIAPVVRTNLFAGAQINVTGQLTVDLSNLHYNPGNQYGIIAICLGTLATSTSDVSLQLAGINPEWKIITDNKLLAGVKLETAGGRDLTGTVLNSQGMDSNGCFYVIVPEPSTATLSLLALSALVMRRRRK